MCVEAKAVSDTTNLHVSISVLGKAMIWQARLVLVFKDLSSGIELDEHDNHYQRSMKSMAA